VEGKDILKTFIDVVRGSQELRNFLIHQPKQQPMNVHGYVISCTRSRVLYVCIFGVDFGCYLLWWRVLRRPLGAWGQTDFTLFFVYLCDLWHNVEYKKQQFCILLLKNLVVSKKSSTFAVAKVNNY